MAKKADPSPAEQHLSTALACAVLTPALRTILVFDADPERFQQVANTAGAMLETITERPTVCAHLGGGEDDDLLFGGLGLVGQREVEEQDDGQRRATAGSSIAYRPGLFDQSDDPESVRLVLMPDATQLGLSAARACAMLMAADIAHIERHGQQRMWRPNLFWLAACRRADVGQVSSHLLDRFALRLDAASFTLNADATALRRFLARDISEPRFAYDPDQLNRVAQCHITVSEDALDLVLAAFPVETGASPPSPRRPIALAWVAVALARLECAMRREGASRDAGASPLTADHVTRARALIGLAPKQEMPPPRQTVRHKARTGDEEERSALRPPRPTSAGSDGLTVYQPSDPKPADNAVHLPTSQETRSAGPLGAEIFEPGEPYPEDRAAVAREHAPLRLPMQRRIESRAARGTIVGAMRTDGFQDLALSSTLFEAAKYQAHRRLLRGQPEALHRRHDRPILFPEDLRRYRRIPPAEGLLVLVLDYTCLDGWDWGAAILPYLRDAYVERAAICLVQVGAADAEHELRARRVAARSILAPAIAAALGAERGTATPLAHGLYLANEALRHALHHGRDIALRARLVVVTDGRGNVPLEASRAGRITPPVRDEGIRDAMAVAARLAELPRVKTLLIHPSPRHYRDLPTKLGRALGKETKIRALGREGGS